MNAMEISLEKCCSRVKRESGNHTKVADKNYVRMCENAHEFIASKKEGLLKDKKK